MNFTCAKCGEDFVDKEWCCSVLETTCPHCGAVNEVDWDYVDYSSIAAWTDGIKGDDQ